MRIEVICTGDEVLTGKIVNTNFTYITRNLKIMACPSNGRRPSAMTAKTCCKRSGPPASGPTR